MSQSFLLTFLADNSVMELIPDAGPVTRLSEPGRNFLAEHGFSVLVTTPDNAHLLFDAGVSEQVVPHNLALLGLDPSRDLRAAVLSHGHADHAGAVQRLRCPLHAHPEALGPRFLQRAGEVRFDLTAHALPFVRDRLLLSAEPTEVLPEVWTTGEIPRGNTWEDPVGFLRIRQGRLEEDHIPDDQGLALVTPAGLVVIAGCAHAGIINTITQAQQVTGVERIRAVVGGFHLLDADAQKLDSTIAALRDFEPEILAPNHCTGFRASAALAAAFPGQFVYVTCGHQLSLG